MIDNTKPQQEFRNIEKIFVGKVAENMFVLSAIKERSVFFTTYFIGTVKSQQNGSIIEMVIYPKSFYPAVFCFSLIFIYFVLSFFLNNLASAVALIPFVPYLNNDKSTTKMYKHLVGLLDGKDITNEYYKNTKHKFNKSETNKIFDFLNDKEKEKVTNISFDVKDFFIELINFNNVFSYKRKFVLNKTSNEILDFVKNNEILASKIRVTTYADSFNVISAVSSIFEDKEKVYILLTGVIKENSNNSIVHAKAHVARESFLIGSIVFGFLMLLFFESILITSNILGLLLSAIFIGLIYYLLNFYSMAAYGKDVDNALDELGQIFDTYADIVLPIKIETEDKPLVIRKVFADVSYEKSKDTVVNVAEETPLQNIDMPKVEEKYNKDLQREILLQMPVVNEVKVKNISKIDKAIKQVTGKISFNKNKIKTRQRRRLMYEKAFFGFNRSFYSPKQPREVAEILNAYFNSNENYGFIMNYTFSIKPKALSVVLLSEFTGLIKDSRNRRGSDVFLSTAMPWYLLTLLFLAVLSCLNLLGLAFLVPDEWALIIIILFLVLYGINYYLSKVVAEKIEDLIGK